MALLWEGRIYTLANSEYILRLITILQPSIKILNKSSYVSEDMKEVPSLLLFVTIWSSCSLKRVFLEKSLDATLCFSELWFASYLKGHPGTRRHSPQLQMVYIAPLLFWLPWRIFLSFVECLSKKSTKYGSHLF